MKIGGGGVRRQLVMYQILPDIRFYQIPGNTGYRFVPDIGSDRIPDS